MATTDMNAQMHIKDENGNVNNIFPATKIANVEGLTAALNAKADTTTVNNQLTGKVDKENGKGLSTNDYTSAEKNKLSGIEAQANKTIVDNALSSSSENPVQNKVINTAIAGKADASAVSSLSSQVSTNTTNIATQTARIDSIASLPSGSTSGDAELMDIRVKADGETASTAGDAVREQITSLSEREEAIIKSHYERGTNWTWERGIEDGKKVNSDGTISDLSQNSVLTWDLTGYDFVEITDGGQGSGAGAIQFVCVYIDGQYSKTINRQEFLNKIVDVSKYTELKLTAYTTNKRDKFVIPWVKRIEPKVDKVVIQKMLPVLSVTDDRAYQYMFPTPMSNTKMYTYDVSNVDSIKTPLFVPKAYCDSIVLLDHNNKCISYKLVTTADAVQYDNIDTRYASKLCVTAQTAITPRVMAYDTQYGTLAGKTAVWFGTSIPWGGAFQNESYPFMVGGLTGMRVYNESVPESLVTAQYDTLVSESNPYGFGNNWNKAVKSLGSTKEAIMWAIDNYNSSVFTTGQPSSRPTGWEAISLAANSYETKVLRYLSQAQTEYESKYQYGEFVGDVDYYVFNHGHNDDMYYNGNTGFTAVLNKLMDIILQYNPSAKIVIISEYENSTESGQRIDGRLAPIAASRHIPYFKLYDSLGWTQEVLPFYGHWVYNQQEGGYDWVETSETHEMTIFAANVPDGIHPNTDRALKGTKKIALACANFLQSI